LNVKVAADNTYAQVAGGLRPTKTPRLAATAGIDWWAMLRLTQSAYALYESSCYDDDLNTHRLDPGVTLDAQAHLTR
jgi:hypothetical protein